MVLTTGVPDPSSVGDLFPAGGDGYVDGNDLGVLLANWGTITSPNAADLYPLSGGDGVVDGNDLGVLLANWNPIPAPITAGGSDAVPEPSSIILAFMGILALLSFARRKN